MINKNNKYWKEAIMEDKIKQSKGWSPMSETDIFLTALHFERCDRDAEAAIAFDIRKREEGQEDGS